MCNNSFTSNVKATPTNMLQWLAAVLPPHGRKICTSAWTLRLRSASVGGSEQAVSSTSHLRGPTLCAQSCLLLESEASAELGAKFSDDAESFGSPQAVTDDCETRRDCLIDSQCKPPSNDRPDTLALIHCNPTSLGTQ